MKFFKLTTLAAALIAGTAAQAVTNVSTNIEMNNLWVTDIGLTQTGRVEVNLESKQGKDGYVAAKASLIAGRDGSASTDDMWIQLGNSATSLKLGRFQATDLFPLGKGASFYSQNDYVAKAAGSTGYQADVLRGRTGLNASGWNSFHGALGFNTGTAATGALAVELGVVESKNIVGSDNIKGFRPVVTGDLGMFKVSLGAEAVKQFSGTSGITESYTGFGVTAGFKTSAEASYNLNYAGRSHNGVKNNSFGLNGNFGPLGLGVVLDKLTNTPTTSTFYGSYELPLFGIPGASMVPALSYSKASGATSVTGVNVRLNYTF